MPQIFISLWLKIHGTQIPFPRFEMYTPPSCFSIAHQNLLLPSNCNAWSTGQCSPIWDGLLACLVVAVSPWAVWLVLNSWAQAIILSHLSVPSRGTGACHQVAFVSQTKSIHQNLLQQNVCDFCVCPKNIRWPQQLPDGFYCSVHVKQESIFFSTYNLWSSAPNFYYLSYYLSLSIKHFVSRFYFTIVECIASIFLTLSKYIQSKNAFYRIYCWQVTKLSHK